MCTKGKYLHGGSCFHGSCCAFLEVDFCLWDPLPWKLLPWAFSCFHGSRPRVEGGTIFHGSHASMEVFITSMEVRKATTMEERRASYRVCSMEECQLPRTSTEEVIQSFHGRNLETGIPQLPRTLPFRGSCQLPWKWFLLPWKRTVLPWKY